LNSPSVPRLDARAAAAGAVKREATMTRIRVLSDLHIEFGGLELPAVEADVAVLAGDVHVGIESARWSFAMAERLGIPVVLVAGNHEHYGGARDPEISLANTIAEFRAAAAASDGRLVFLERQSVVVAGVRFVGCTLWTDFELFGDPAEAMAHAGIAMTDFHAINRAPGVRFTPNDARREFTAARRFLEAELAKPWSGPTVVVTHHLPSARSVPLRFRDHPLTPAYASHLDALVERSSAALWAHGHTHDAADHAIGATRIMCNPRGYVGYGLNPRFEPGKVVTVDGAVRKA
jgi:predicted phosphodiesterase